MTRNEKLKLVNQVVNLLFVIAFVLLIIKLVTA